MPEGYASLLVYAALLSVVGGGMLAATIVVPRILGTRRPNAVKLEAYECGVEPFTEGARGRVSVRFYLVAILFILFDVETVFLLPWAAEYGRLGLAATIEVVVFLGLLLLGYVYVWKRGALEWD